MRTPYSTEQLYRQLVVFNTAHWGSDDDQTFPNIITMGGGGGGLP